MATLDQLNARLESLYTALGSAQMVQHGDLRVQNRSIAEIRTAIGAIEQQIAAAGGQAIVRSIKLTSSKDL